MLSARALREVFHFCFLERLLRVADSRLFVLKGGVNLRFFFHSPRYSEDMDIDVLGGAVATLRKDGYKILADAAFRRALSTYGIADVEVNDPAKAKHTETTQRFRVRLRTTAGERLPSKVEFSRRRGRDAPGSGKTAVDPVDSEVARRYNRLSFRCLHYSGEAAVAQKILALAGRPVTQARDVFDLDVLQRGGYVRPEGLFHIAPDKRAAARENLASLSFDDFAGQVLEFLDDEVKREFSDRAVWNSMVEQQQRLLK